MMSFPIVGVLYFVLIGVIGDKLPMALNDTAAAASVVTVSNVLGYCASQIGYTASFAGVSSDFVSNHHNTNTHTRQRSSRRTLQSGSSSRLSTSAWSGRSSASSCLAPRVC
jgi:hypothetical protein